MFPRKSWDKLGFHHGKIRPKGRLKNLEESLRFGGVNLDILQAKFCAHFFWRREIRDKSGGVAVGTGRDRADVVPRKEAGLFRREGDAEQGFTLIELLTASAILAIIGLAILTAFGSGFHVYERIQSFGGPQMDVLIALEQFEKDARSALGHKTILFHGDEKSVYFPSIIEISKIVEDKEIISRALGQVGYVFDPEAKTLARGQSDYAGALSGAFSNTDETSLASVEDVRFEYFFYDPDNLVHAWKNSWEAQEAVRPGGIRVSVTFLDGARPMTWTRTVFFPAVDETSEEPDEESQQNG